LAILVISRDIIIMLGFAVLYVITGHSIVVRPTLVGKASTFFQLLTVTLTLVKLHNPAWQFPLLLHAALVLAGGAVTISGVQYLSRALWWLNLQDEQDAQEPPVWRGWRPEKEALHEVREKDRQRYSA
jgi:phosphatidylglycerophosphate synthase